MDRVFDGLAAQQPRSRHPIGGNLEVALFEGMGERLAGGGDPAGRGSEEDAVTSDHNTDTHERRLRIFLAHGSEDRQAMIELHARLLSAGFTPWLDVIDLLGGQNWRAEIPRVIRASDVFLACLSSRTASKSGYIQKELRLALDAYAEKPPNTIFLIPVKLDDCDVPDVQIPQLGVSLTDLQWVDLWASGGWDRLVAAIRQVSASRDSSPSAISRLSFTTDRIRDNSLGFTVTNPPGSSTIRITDVEILPAGGHQLQAAVERRFKLADAKLHRSNVPGDHYVLGDVVRGQSVFVDDEVIRVDANDAASFQLDVFADETYISVDFALRVVYIDQFGNVKRLSSDALYLGQKQYLSSEIASIEMLTVDEIRQRLLDHDCGVVDTLRFFQESDFSGIDLFDILMHFESSGRCGGGALQIIGQLGDYTTTERRRAATLARLQALDDLTDFDVKYHYVVNLVLQRDRRAVPFALGLLSKIAQRDSMMWRGGGTAYLALFDLRDLLKDYLDTPFDLAQPLGGE
jgi:hypothetical protein